MKAWVLHGISDLKLENVDMPAIADNEVLVEVKAAGICGSDIARVYKTGAHVHPLIPGHEFSGIVKEVGNDTNKQWLGKRVGIFPLIPCKKCLPCRNKQYELCRHYNYLGSRQDGGFAEYVKVPIDNLILLPDEVSFEEAAMLEPMAVAVHAMRRVNVSGMDTVVVYGLGTIGMFLTMFLKEAGVRNILVVGNKDFQRETVLSLGLREENYCDSRKKDARQWILDCTDGMGADIFFECIGKNEIISQGINVTAPSGSICLVGNPYSDMNLDKNVYWKILRNQLLVTGTWNSSFLHDSEDDWNYVLKRLEQKSIMPEQLISHKYPLEELAQGLQIMRDKTEDYIKIMACI